MNEGEAVVNEALHEMQRFSRGKDKAFVKEHCMKLCMKCRGFHIK